MTLRSHAFALRCIFKANEIRAKRVTIMYKIYINNKITPVYEKVAAN